MEQVQEKLQLLRSKLGQIPALQQAEVSFCDHGKLRQAKIERIRILFVFVFGVPICRKDTSMYSMNFALFHHEDV